MEMRIPVKIYKLLGWSDAVGVARSMARMDFRRFVSALENPAEPAALPQLLRRYAA